MKVHVAVSPTDHVVHLSVHPGEVLETATGLVTLTADECRTLARHLVTLAYMVDAEAAYFGGATRAS